MALKPFNSVAGFSTGETAVTIIDGNGNVSSNSLSVLATANITGNISAGNINTSGLVTVDSFNSLALPNSRLVYVDNNRTDTYNQNGSPEQPFKTIAAAITWANANVTGSVPVSFVLANGTFAETIDLNNTTLTNISFTSLGRVSVNPASGNSLQATTGVSGVLQMAFRNIEFGKPVVITGDGTTNQFNSVTFTDCSFSDALTVTTVNSIAFWSCSAFSTVTFTNINYTFYNSGQIQGLLTLAASDATTLPSAGMAPGIVLMFNVIGNPVTLTKGTGAPFIAWQPHNCRFGLNAGTYTIPATFSVTAYNSTFNGTWVNDGTFSLRNTSTANAVGNVGSTYTGIIGGTSVVGSLTTAAQPNITSVGTLANLSVTGNITGANVVIATTVLANTIGNAASVLFGDGANITGLSAGYSNSDVANYLASGSLDSNIITTANITGGNFATVGGANVGTLTVTTDANIGGNALVTGNLTVEGNLIYINVESLTVEDPIITVGTGPNGAALTTNDGKDRGLAMEYFDTTAKFAYAGYKNATGTYSGDYVIAKEATLSTDVVTVVTLANVVAGIYKGTFEAPGNTGEVLFNDGANIAANSTFTFDVANSELAVGNIVSSGTANVGTLEVTGEANVGGNLVITGNTDSGNITTLGTANIATLEVTGEANVGGNLVVTGNISGGNIATVGTANIGTLEVTGEANVAGNLNVTETATANIVSITTQAEIAGTSILSAGVVATSSTTPTTLFVGGSGFGYEVTVKASDGANIMITKLLSTPAGDYTLYGQTVTGNAPGAISVSSAANTVTVTVTSAAATPTTYTYQATGL